jgi:hypothetical protein
LTDRKLTDVRGIELEVGQLVSYGRAIGRSISISLAEVVELKPAENPTDWKGYPRSDDKVMIKYLFEGWGANLRTYPDKPVGVMPERVMVITGVPQ